MPTVTTAPIIADLLDRFKVCTEEELKQLALDLYELGRFGAYGFEQNEIPWQGQMPTSLHSCGSQLGLCPCGCRMFPFCDDRLIAKGLHGLLVRLEDTVRCGYKEYQCYRHVHPAELALFNGMIPDLDWGQNSKMALCALGQIASPIQATWVGSLLMQTLQNIVDHPAPIEPYENLMQWFDKLLDGRDKVFGPQTNPNAKLFRHLVTTRVFATKIPPQIHHIDTHDSPGDAHGQAQVPKPAGPMQADHVQPSTRPDQHASVIQGPFVQSSVAEHPTVSESLMPGCRVTATANFADHQVTPHASGGVTGFETCCAKARKRMSCDDAASNSRTESKPSSQAVAADHLPNETIRATEPVREVPAFAADHVQTKLCPLGKIDTANDPAYGDISLSALPTFNTRHDNNRHAQQQCPSLHPGLDRPPMSPPAPFHAMPLPRLGCGGPSQCDENDGKSDADPAFPTTKIANALGKTIEVTQKILPQCFTADCGFQSVAWLLAILSNLPVEAMTDDRAAQWRQLFINELCRQDKCDEWISHLDLGGAKLDQSEMTKLTSLLTQHGVWPDRALERANQLISAMPAVNIRNILASHRPWQDLKAAANGVKPQIKLIMIDELNAQIANRADQRKYGKKMSSHKRHEPAKDNPTAQASELMVPQGVFKQQDGTILGPLQIGDVGPNAKGVLLVDQADCQATLRLPKPVSQMGLAVIVLATKNNEDMHSITPTRFTAMCLSTQEPLIASGYMYQLGHQEVIRHEPSNKLAIDEQPTEAIRCMVFKDQAGDFWEQLQQQPVNHIFQTEPLLATPPGSTSIVIDVWDRQWVSKKYEKVRPANAEVFTFSMRMLADKADELLAKSGQAGVYWEPRSACGRFPNSNYHVTWLPQMTFQDAKYAQQTSPQATTLARHGERYGLRSDTLNAQEIHEKHRPDTPLLLGQSKMLYAVGHLPFSTTKAALCKLLKAWSWDARPLQPKGRAQDGSGITWHIQAVEDPGHWVYSLQHGDVLVTKLQDPKPPTMPSLFPSLHPKRPSNTCRAQILGSTTTHGGKTVLSPAICRPNKCLPSPRDSQSLMPSLPPWKPVLTKRSNRCTNRQMEMNPWNQPTSKPESPSLSNSFSRSKPCNLAPMPRWDNCSSKWANKARHWEIASMKS